MRNLIINVIKRNIILITLIISASILFTYVYVVRGNNEARPTAAATAAVPQRWNDCAGYVALTYDDGPNAATPVLLKTLSTNQLRATFFVLGSEVSNNPETVRAIVSGRHVVANHTMTHPDLTTLDAAGREAQLRQTSEAIARVTGTAPLLFRPPMGLTSPQIRELATSLGMIEVIWNVDTFDWRDDDINQMLQSVANLKDGDIVLMHDSAKYTIELTVALARIMESKRLCPGMIVRSNAPVKAFGDVVYYAKAVSW